MRGTPGVKDRGLACAQRCARREPRTTGNRTDAVAVWDDSSAGIAHTFGRRHLRCGCETRAVNCAALLLDAQDQGALALVCRGAGSRSTFTFGEIGRLTDALAAQLDAQGVGPGDVVMTLFGNRPEWVVSMVAALHVGGVVLPCLEQLRAKDLLARMQATRPQVVLADARNRASLQAAVDALPSEQQPWILEPTICW